MGIVMRALSALVFSLFLATGAVQAASEVEPNNDSSTATPLPPLTPITGTQSDDDWYVLSVPAGATHIIIDLSFTHADGNIEVELRDNDLFKETTSNSTDDNEFIDLNGFITNGTSSYIRVYGHATDGDKDNEYTLTWTYLSVDSDDDYEPNDNISAAVSLSAKTPENIMATAADAEVTLSWDAVSDAEAYTVYWNTTGNVTASDDSIDAGTNTQIVHSGLTNGTSYYYRVVANKSNELIFGVLGQNEDWYSFYAHPGTELVNVILKHKTAATGSNGADLDLELFDKDGTSITSATGTEENEVLTADFVTAGLTEGTYNIRVTGPAAISDNKPTGYSLIWEDASASAIVSSGSSELSTEVSAIPTATAATNSEPAGDSSGSLSLYMILILWFSRAFVRQLRAWND